MYEPNKKIISSDDKFKEFSYLIKTCKVCNGKGYEFKIEKDESGLVIPGKSTKSVECDCIKKAYQFALFKDAHIPSEYWGMSIKNFFKKPENLEVRKIMEKIMLDIRTFHQTGLGIFFYGGPGTGKSLLSVEILKKALKNELSGHYDWFPLIIDTFMKKGYTADAEKEAYNDIFEKKDILIIDEIGKETQDKNFTKQDIARILEINILKKRSNKTTILISNLQNIEDLKSQYGIYVDSVIRHSFKTINLVGTDFRNEGAVNQFFGSIEKENNNG